MEASGRVGGRMYTKYGKGWYADLGAMRYHKDHILLKGVRILRIYVFNLL